MADQRVDRRIGFIVERDVELIRVEIGAQRTADLHALDRTAALRPAADLVDEFAECDAECGLIKAAMLDVAGELDRHRAARATHAIIRISLGSLGEDVGHGGEAEHIVDDRRAAEQPDQCRDRRLGADFAALAFQAV